MFKTGTSCAAVIGVSIITALPQSASADLMGNTLTEGGFAWNMARGDSNFDPQLYEQNDIGRDTVGGGGGGNLAIPASSTASLGLRYATQAGDGMFINDGQDVSVLKGSLEPIGQSTLNGSTIFGFWQEFAFADTNRVEVTWFTNDISDLLPPGQTLNGESADFMDWRVGAVDAIDFPSQNVTNVAINRASLSFVSSSGQPQQDFSFTLQLSGPWNGTDFNLRQLVPGSGYDVLIMQYDFTFDIVPAPASTALGLIGLMGLGRRRR